MSLKRILARSPPHPPHTGSTHACTLLATLQPINLAQACTSHAGVSNFRPTGIDQLQLNHCIWQLSPYSCSCVCGGEIWEGGLRNGVGGRGGGDPTTQRSHPSSFHACSVPPIPPLATDLIETSHLTLHRPHLTGPCSNIPAQSCWPPSPRPPHLLDQLHPIDST